MRLWSTIKSLFRRPSPPDGLVPYYDVPSGRVVRIPPSELRPGCVQVKMQGIDEVVWVATQEIEEGPVRHPPFEEDVREYIREIQTALAEHRDLSFEEWEIGFRRDGNPLREIAIFVHAARVYCHFTDDEADPVRRADVYRLLIACMTTSPDSFWHVVKLDALTRPEGEQIARRFFGGEQAEKSAG